jgi:hypothetical protein
MPKTVILLLSKNVSKLCILQVNRQRCTTQVELLFSDFANWTKCVIWSIAGAARFGPSISGKFVREREIVPLWRMNLLQLYRLCAVQYCCLLWHDLGGATVDYPCGFGLVASRFFSVSLKVLPQGNLRSRSLQNPRSATAGWLTNTTLSSGFLFIHLWQFTFGLKFGIL